MKKDILLLMLCLFCSIGAMAQTKTITGVVSDAAGEPIIGASVVEVGTTNGTITDIDGKFVLNMNPDGKIRVSYIGYQVQTIDLKGKTSFRIQMKEDSEMLEEVVVTGYGGKQLRTKVTNSISKVKEETLKQGLYSNPGQALSGAVAGLSVSQTSGNPGSTPTLVLRGGTNFDGSGSPLILIDGQVRSSLSDINPDDIESMEVLKDAASAAIYGAEAGNGVVLITTKSGAKGRGSITYSGKWTKQSLGSVPNLLNATQFKDWMTMQLGAESVNATLADAQTQYGWDPNTDTDWLDAYFEDTWAQQHTLTFQGGNDRGSYFLSVNHVNQDGIVKGSKDKYERLTAQLNADYMIKDWLKVGTNTSIEKWSSRGISEQGYGSSFEMLILRVTG